VRIEDLLKGNVDVDFVVRLERKNDSHIISNKTFDFSKTTIQQLIQDGYQETKEQMKGVLERIKRELSGTSTSHNITAYHIITNFVLICSFFGDKRGQKGGLIRNANYRSFLVLAESVGWSPPIIEPLNIRMITIKAGISNNDVIIL
jgi:hypothetical protein